MIVFCSMSPEQIDLGRTNARGVDRFQALPRVREARRTSDRRGVLADRARHEIAVRGRRQGGSRSAQAGPFTRRSVSPISGSISASCTRTSPGVYLAGVEADGAQLSSLGHRPRPRQARQAALESLGWRIRRIWSTEWWLDIERLYRESPPAPSLDARAGPRRRATATGTTTRRPDRDVDQARTRLPEVTPPLDDATPAEAPDPPEPEEDKAQIEKFQTGRVYADPVLARPSFTPPSETYREGSPADVVLPDQARFYDAAYRPELRRMVDHVIAVEGPLYFDLLVERISRAHGFQRAKNTIREIIISALGRDRYPHTQDDGQELIWPAGADPLALCPWRGLGRRNHHQLPLAELASLAKGFVDDGFDDETTFRAMQEALELGRLTTQTRERFLRAIERARVTSYGSQ